MDGTSLTYEILSVKTDIEPDSESIQRVITRGITELLPVIRGIDLDCPQVYSSAYRPISLVDTTTDIQETEKSYFCTYPHMIHEGS